MRLTDQQKAAFLKSEGWKKNLLGTGIYWADPVTPSSGEEWVQMCPFDEAYRLASRRRSARLRRIVKAAGYKATRPKGLPGWWWINKDGVPRSLGRAAGRVELLAKARAGGQSPETGEAR